MKIPNSLNRKPETENRKRYYPPVPQPGVPSQPDPLLGMLFFFSWSFSLLVSGIYFFLPLYLKETLKFSGSQIGLLYGILSLNAIMSTFPLGVAGDRYSVRHLFRVGLAVTALSIWGLGALSHFWAYFLAFWGFGLGIFASRQLMDIMLFKVCGDNPARSFGNYNAWRMGGTMLGTLVAGLLFYRLDFPATLKLLAMIVLLLLIPTPWLPATEIHKTTWWQYRRDFFNRSVLFFAAWLFLFSLHWGAETTSYGLFLNSNLALNPQEMGYYMAGEFTVLGITAFLYGRYWAGRLRPAVFLSIALVTSGLGHILMTIPDVLISFLFRGLHGLGDGLVLMESYATIARLFHVQRVGGNSSLITLVTTLGSFIGALIFGPLGASWGYQWPLIISGATTLALLPLAFYGLRE